MDSSTAAECAEIAAALGGNQAVCDLTGSVATPRFTGPQIRRFAKQDPAAWARTKRVHLVSSFFASVLAGADAAIDTGDGAGMNLMDIRRGDWSPAALAATAPDLAAKLPPVRPGSTVAGGISAYFVARHGFSPKCRVVIGTGDNPSSLVGMGASKPGKVVISLGTSDTLFAAIEGIRTDAAGLGHAFGNPLGGSMSLVCVRNGSLAREAIRRECGHADWAAFSAAVLVVPGAHSAIALASASSPNGTVSGSPGSSAHAITTRSSPPSSLANAAARTARRRIHRFTPAQIRTTLTGVYAPSCPCWATGGRRYHWPGRSSLARS
jgi:xylulokinase